MRNILYGGIMPKTLIFTEGEGGGGGGGGEGEGEDKPKNLKEFASQFSVSKVNPMLIGKPPTQAQIDAVKKNSGEAIVDDSEEGEEELSPEEKEEKRKQAQEQLEQQRRKGPGANKPKILEDKRKAEAERDAAKAEFEKFKKESETKINELQAKIDSGKFSEAKEKEFTDKITKLESEIQTERESLTKENQKLKTRLGYYDLAENEDFQKTYMEPVTSAYQDAIDAIGADEAKQGLLDRALMANAAALRAPTPQARLAAEKERDNLLSQIEESLPGFTAKRFASSMGDYIMAAKRHAAALLNHEQTAKEMREKFQQERTKSYARTVETWGKTFDATSSGYDEETKMEKDDIAKAKELGLRDPDEEAKALAIRARKVVTGQGTMDDSIELVQKGRVYPVLKAKLAVTEHRLKDALAQIAKLRKGGTGGGEQGNRQGDGKQTRAEWQSKFSANRAGAAKGGGE